MTEQLTLLISLAGLILVLDLVVGRFVRARIAARAQQSYHERGATLSLTADLADLRQVLINLRGQVEALAREGVDEHPRDPDRTGTQLYLTRISRSTVINLILSDQSLDEVLAAIGGMEEQSVLVLPSTSALSRILRRPRVRFST